jgi:hypothetical protein
MGNNTSNCPIIAVGIAPKSSCVKISVAMSIDLLSRESAPIDSRNSKVDTKWERFFGLDLKKIYIL